MLLTINVPESFAEQARAAGMEPEPYAERLLNGESVASSDEERREAIQAAVDELRELRKGNRLDGLSVRDLIREGRKY